MTLCEVTFRCPGQLSERQLGALEQLKGQVYGMKGFRIPSEGEQLVVSYDASRLKLADVQAALHGAGVPVVV